MKVIRIRESFFESVLSDLFTFTMLAGLWYLNHNFLGSSGVIDFFIAFSVIIGVTNKIDTKYSVKSAVEFLQSDEAQQYIKENIVKAQNLKLPNSAMVEMPLHCCECKLESQCVAFYRDDICLTLLTKELRK